MVAEPVRKITSPSRREDGCVAVREDYVELRRAPKHALQVGKPGRPLRTNRVRDLGGRRQAQQPDGLLLASGHDQVANLPAGGVESSGDTPHQLVRVCKVEFVVLEGLVLVPS